MDDDWNAAEGEVALHRAVAEMESRRISSLDAHHSFDRGPCLVLVSVGKAWALALIVLMIALEAVAVLAIQSLALGIATLAALVVVVAWAHAHLDDWVDDHNARLDVEIRALLEREGS